MRQNNSIFVLVDRVAIIAPAIFAFDGGKRIELLAAQSARSAEMAVGDRPGAIPIVSLVREDGPQRAVRLARRGARVVICVVGNADRRSELRELAPTNFILRAGTAEQLVKALRAALGHAANVDASGSVCPPS